jgi:hypothetical protein
MAAILGGQIMVFDPTRKPKEATAVSSGKPFDPTVAMVARRQTPPDYSGLAEESGPVQAGLISVGKGLYNVGRGVGLLDAPDDIERASFEALEKEHPKSTMIGQAVGEAAPFLPAGVGVGAIRATVPRVLAGMGLGAAEGGVIARGRNENPLFGAILGGSLAGAGEILLPGVVRAGDSLFRKVTGRAPKGALIAPDGTVARELQEVLDAQGITLDDIAEKEIRRLQGSGQLSTEQAERIARFRSEGVDPTLGDITQDFGQQTVEARLFESSADSLADPYRSARLQQSDRLRSNMEGMVDDLGDPSTAGEGVKSALSQRKSALRKKKNRFYDIAAKRADVAGDVPVFTDGIVSALPDGITVQRVKTLVPQQGKALDNLLVQFGLDSSEESLKRFKGEVTPLSVKNFENFRTALNQIEKSDITGTVANLTSPLKKALDNELDDMVKIVDDSGVISPVIAALKKARGTVREIKTEFSPQSMVGKLVDVKRDGVTPVIEASQAVKKLMAKAQPTENLSKVVSSLRGSSSGRKAIADMQASTVLGLINDAFSTQSRKVQGVPLFNPIAFRNALKSVGDDKLEVLFKDNPGVLKRVRNIAKIAEDMTPPSGAQPKGSANVILDQLQKLGIISLFGKIPGGGIFAEGITGIARNRATRKGVDKALSPRLDRVATVLEKEFPQIASAIGIPLAMSATSEE